MHFFTNITPIPLCLLPGPTITTSTRTIFRFRLRSQTLPEWDDLSSLDASILHPNDAAAVDGSANVFADIGAYMRSLWLRNAELPPERGWTDLPLHLRAVDPHHAELALEEDDVLPKERVIPPLPHSEDNYCPLIPPPAQENATAVMLRPLKPLTKMTTRTRTSRRYRRCLCSRRRRSLIVALMRRL